MTAKGLSLMTHFCQQGPTLYRLHSLPKSHHQFWSKHIHNVSQKGAFQIQTIAAASMEERAKQEARSE